MASGSGSSWRHLLRLRRCIPLAAVQQGGTLSVRSTCPNVKLRVQPQWRENGHVTLLQQFGDGSGRLCPATTNSISMRDQAHVTVRQDEDQMTSLGRSESHVSIVVESLPAYEIPILASTTTSNVDDSITVEYHDGLGRVEATVRNATSTAAEVGKEDAGVHTSVILKVPEKINFTCVLEEGGSVDIEGKVEGDVHLTTTNGDIRVTKLRGHSVNLNILPGSLQQQQQQQPIASIYAAGLLEAENLNIALLQGGRLRVKRIHGEKVDIHIRPHPSSPTTSTDDSCIVEPWDEDDQGSLVDISSMYVSGTGGAHVTIHPGLRPMNRAVRIKSHHGPVLVNVGGVSQPVNQDEFSLSAHDSDGRRSEVYPLVELGSVNGSCEVSVRDTAMHGGGEAVHAKFWNACKVHFDSMSPESVSLVTTDSGNVALSFDRKLEADLRLLSTSTKSASLNDIGVTLAEEDSSDQAMETVMKLPNRPTSTENGSSGCDGPSRISIVTPSFTESAKYESSGHQTQYVEGWIENKSNEPDSRFEMKTRGEVASVGKVRLDGAADQALQMFSSPRTHDKDKDGLAEKTRLSPDVRPLIVVASAGKIHVESLSWMGAIARRYGLDEQGRDLGRTAARRGRTLLPSNE